MVVTTPCKINLYLGIHPECDSRGYHRVDSLMVPVALFDTVTVSEAERLEVIHTPALEVSYEKTTVWRAAMLLAEELGKKPNLHIEINTQIPERAGLGGSSADAGATLRALAQLWGLDPLDKQVVQVARRVGADVSFFLDPRPGLYFGAGDVLESTFEAPELPLALVMPHTAGGSTKETYDEFDRKAAQPRSYASMVSALGQKDPQVIANNLYNNLAPAAVRLNPEIGEVTDWLLAQEGVLGAQVTGSGACSFAICKTAQDAAKIVEEAQQMRGWRAWATKTIGSPAQFC